MADQSSSSAALPLVRLGAATGSGRACCCLATSALDNRWKGLVFFVSVAAGLVTAGVTAAGEAATDCCDMLRKNGFLDCSGGLLTAAADRGSSTAGLAIPGIGGGGGGADGLVTSGTGGGDDAELKAVAVTSLWTLESTC